MSVWSIRRQISFILVFILLITGGLLYLIYTNRTLPTCTDRIANQGELGVDCGGPCELVCKIETTDLVIHWARSFKVRDGLYDVVALIENPNPFALKAHPYRMRVYDVDNVPVKEVTGSVYINPREKMSIFVPTVNVGERIPTRVLIEFTEESLWARKVSSKIPTFEILNTALTIEPSGEVVTTIINKSSFPVDNIELTSIVYSTDSTALAASRTKILHMEAGEERKVVFTWPRGLDKSATRADISARVNLSDDGLLMI